MIRYQSGRERVAKRGNWRLNAARAEPEDLNGQIRWSLSQVESDIEVWKSLVEEFDVDIFCGLFMQGTNDGMTLASDVMVLLGERGIHLAHDIYSSSEDD